MAALTARELTKQCPPAAGATWCVSEVILVSVVSRLAWREHLADRDHLRDHHGGRPPDLLGPRGVRCPGVRDVAVNPVAGASTVTLASAEHLDLDDYASPPMKPMCRALIA